MSELDTALGWAEARVATVRDDPAARLALLDRTYHGPTGRAPRHLPFRRAALSFMRWQAQRGLLNPLDGSPSGSHWWRAMNERLLRDGCEAVALVGGRTGEPSSQPVRLWLRFIDTPTPSCWYRAHNASIVAGYLEHERWPARRTPPSASSSTSRWCAFSTRTPSSPRRGLALGRLAWLARLAGDPRFGLTGVFVALRRVIPDQYPLDRDVEWYVADEQRLGRLLDYGVIAPRIQPLYEWSARTLGEPRLLELVREGNPIYVWPYEQRHVWRSSQVPSIQRVVERATRVS